ncbi:MAG TPA: porin family protein [Flavisolibacter sp.]|nr:porin family protein [Flavisolibacter sp.]
MKMKILSLITAGFLLASQSHAQSGARIQVGLNLANVSVTDNGKVNDANTLNSFQVGLVGDVRLGSVLYFQPGLLYTGKGSKVQNGNTSGNYYKETFNPHYIEMPLNFVAKIPLGVTKVFVGAGPYVAVGVSGKSKVEGSYAGVGFSNENDIKFSNDDPTTLNYEEGAGFGIMKRFDYGLNGTVGIEGKSLLLGVNYGLGLAKLQSGANSSENDNNKNRVFSIILGIKL